MAAFNADLPFAPRRGHLFQASYRVEKAGNNRILSGITKKLARANAARSPPHTGAHAYIFAQGKENARLEDIADISLALSLPVSVPGPYLNR